MSELVRLLPTNLIFVRHGEILDREDRASLAAVRAGKEIPELELAEGLPPEKGLTAEGIRQSACLRDWLSESFPGILDAAAAQGAVEFWMCPSRPGNSRVEETAKIVFGEPGAWQASPLLHDREWGEWGKSLTRRQLKARQRDDEDPYRWTPPGGVSAEAMANRVGRFLGQLATENPPKHAVVACHGEVAIAAIAAVNGMGEARFRQCMQEGRFDMPEGIVVHFSRVDPMSGEAQQFVCAERRICPWDEAHSYQGGAWIDVEHPAV